MQHLLRLDNPSNAYRDYYTTALKPAGQIIHSVGDPAGLYPSIMEVSHMAVGRNQAVRDRRMVRTTTYGQVDGVTVEGLMPLQAQFLFDIPRYGVYAEYATEVALQCLVGVLRGGWGTASPAYDDGSAWLRAGSVLFPNHDAPE